MIIEITNGAGVIKQEILVSGNVKISFEPKYTGLVYIQCDPNPLISFMSESVDSTYLSDMEIKGFTITTDAGYTGLATITEVMP